MKIKNWARIKHKNVDESSIIFADRVDYIANKKGDFFDHHLMFYWKKRLIFKVYLPNEIKDNPFKDVQKACEFVGIRVEKPKKEAG